MPKVTVNKFNIIVLDGNKEGKRYRLSTGQKATKKLIKQYTLAFNTEFEKLYQAKYPKQEELVTFREYGNEILEITKPNRNKFTQRETEYQYQELCKTFGDVYLKDIKVTDILRWQNSLDLAPKTIINYRSTLNLILKYAYHDDLINKNPLEIVKAPKKILQEVQTFSEEDIKKLLNHATGQLKNIITVTLFQGLRGSELIALKWDKIDLFNSTMTIDERIREGDCALPRHSLQLH
jgi:integrase